MVSATISPPSITLTRFIPLWVRISDTVHKSTCGEASRFHAAQWPLRAKANPLANSIDSQYAPNLPLSAAGLSA